MNATPKILPAVCCLALMSACASNQTTSAMPWSIKTSASSSQKPDAMYQLGRYYQGQNRFDEAVNAYLKALNADAKFVEAHNGLGVVYSRQGKYSDAIAAFQTAIQLAPKAAHLYSNMGYTYYLQGNYAESVKALQQATKLDPTNQRALNNLGQAYAKAGNTTKSALAYADAISIEKPNHSAAPAAATPIPAKTADASILTVVPATPASTGTAPVTSAQTSVAVNDHLAVKQEVTVKLETPVKLETTAKLENTVKQESPVKLENTARLVLPVVESRAKLVSIAPNVSELQIKLQPDDTLAVAAAEQPKPLQKVRLEVANGNGVSGAAGKIGKFLRAQGYAFARLTNQKPYKTKQTQIYYRPGHESDAKLVQSALLDAPALVARTDLRSNVNVRVVLGKDMVTQLAHYEYQTRFIQLAANAASAQQFY